MSESIEKPPVQIRNVGQVAAIRKVDPGDPEDMKRIGTIDSSPGVLQWMTGEPCDEEGLLEFVTDDPEHILYGISGSRNVPEQEIGEVQGWVLVYSGEEVRKRAQRGLGGEWAGETLPTLEVSFAKYPGAPEKQIASGLRQVCLDIARKDAQNTDVKGLKPSRIVTAYTGPENTDSIKVLQAAGFVQQGKVVYDPTDSLVEDLFFVLDWYQLHKGVQGTAHRELHLKVT